MKYNASQPFKTVTNHDPFRISGDNLDMEDEITVMYSTTDPTTGYSHLSETTMNPAVEKYIFKWTHEIARLIQIIVRPILIIAGTFGNGLTVYIKRTSSLKELSSCFYMFILALADTSK